MTIEVTDTYEVAYYAMYGGKITGVQARHVRENKRDKKAYPVQWIVAMENVPQKAIDNWHSDMATVEVHRYMAVRKKIKRIIHRFL